MERSESAEDIREVVKMSKLERKLFLIHPAQLEVCFDQCKKAKLGLIIRINVQGVEWAFHPCDEEKCPFEDARLDIGYYELDGKEYHCFLRRLKRERK